MVPQQIQHSKRLQCNRPGALQLHSKQQEKTQQQLSSREQQLTISTKSQVLKSSQLSNVLDPTLISSRSYRQTITQIINSFTTMDSLTLRLEQKVDVMLMKQQQQFIKSYKQHMSKVKEEFSQVDQRIQEYEKKILYYQNQGEMSHLVIKCSKLEEECRKLYKDLASKDKILRDHQLTMKVQKSQIKRYQKEMKLLMRQKNNLMAKLEQLNNNKQPQQHPTPLLNHIQQTTTVNQIISINSTNNLLLFPTQLQHVSHQQKNDLSTEYHLDGRDDRSRDLLKSNKSQNSLTLDFSRQHQQYKDNMLNPSPHNLTLQQKTKELQLRRQISTLKRKNQLLTSHQSHLLQSTTSLQSFFIKCVDQIKHQIKIKKKINTCTLQQWKKQDKIELLIKVLSNDEVLVYLYDKLFRKKKLGQREEEEENNKEIIKGGTVNLTDKVNIGERFSVGRKVSSSGMLNPQEKLAQIGTGFGESKSRDKLFSLLQEKKTDFQERKQKAFSHAKRRVSKHISENSLLPKIHFHLEY